MGAKGISAIVGAVIVAMAFEPVTVMAKIAYGLFGAAAGSIVGETIEAEAVNVKPSVEMDRRSSHFTKLGSLRPASGGAIAT